MNGIKITFKDWDYTCGDGCCYKYGTKIYINGVEVEHPNEEIKDNSYVGNNEEIAVHAVLKHLGYEVEIEKIYKQ
jgi:ArsR family metal-binding transcriptional regulator